MNKGIINVTPAACTWLNNTISDNSKLKYIYIHGGEFFNEGTISMQLKDSIGIRVDEKYLKANSYASKVDKDEPAYFENRATGKILAELEAGAHGIYVFENDNSLINYGTITLNSKTSTPEDASIILSCNLVNQGTINGTGSIGYAGYYDIDKRFPKVSGNKPGLTEKYAYRITPVNENDSSVSSGYKITVDGYTYTIKEYDYNNYYLKSGSHDIKIVANGYKDKTYKLTAASSLSDYAQICKKRDHSVDIKMTKGKGGAVKTVKSVKLKTTTYTYDGKAKKPGVVATDSDGETISSKNYTVKYPSGCKSVGVYKVTVTFKNEFSGKKTLSFTIVPKGTAVKKVTGAKKSLKVTITKQTKETSFYEVQASTDAKFKKGVKSVKTKKNSTTSVTIKGLKKKTAYYVRIRTAKKVGSKTYYSSWKNYKKTVKTK